MTAQQPTRSHRAIMRVAFLGAWVLCIAALAGWLVAAIHRGHLTSMLIVGVGLAATVVLPVLKSRLNQPPPA